MGGAMGESVTAEPLVGHRSPQCRRGTPRMGLRHPGPPLQAGGGQWGHPAVGTAGGGRRSSGGQSGVLGRRAVGRSRALMPLGRAPVQGRGQRPPTSSGGLIAPSGIAARRGEELRGFPPHPFVGGVGEMLWRGRTRLHPHSSPKALCAWGGCVCFHKPVRKASGKKEDTGK